MTEEQLFTEWLSAELPEDEYNQYFQNLAENKLQRSTTLGNPFPFPRED